MATALTAYLQSLTASSTVSTANKLLENVSTGGSLTNKNSNLTSGTTGWVEIWSQGNASAQTGGGSEPAPDARGWLDDGTTLEGNQFASGTWTATIQLETTVTGSFVADIHVRAYQRSSGGTYTLIAEMTLATQTVISTAFTTYTVSAAGVAASNTFATGDKLYIDILLNITTNATTGNMRLEESSSGTLGNVNAQLVTPGYQAITINTMASTDSLTVTDSTLATDVDLPADALSSSDGVSGGPQALLTDALTANDALLQVDGYQPTGIATAALTVYGTVTTSSTVATANTLLENASTGATVTNKNTGLVSGTTGWVEIWSQGNVSTVSGAGSEPAPSGHGWCDDTTSTFAGTQFASGTWSTTLQFETTTTGAFTADIHVRAYQRSSGGVYTLIAEMVLAGQTIISTSFTTFTVSASNVVESGIFASTDHLYIDVLLNILSNATTGNMRIEEANSSTLGNVNMQIATPGYVILTDLDALSANDSFAQSDSYLPIDANTASDATNATTQASATDALTIADTPLYTDTSIPVEALNVSDVILSLLASSFADVQSISDTLAQSDGYAALEALNVSDVTNATDGAALVDANTASDFGNIQAWNIDALSASDALTGTDAGNFIDSNAASDSFAQTENYQISDVQSIADSFVQSDAYLAADVQSVVDALLGIDGSLYIELLPISDSLGQAGPITTGYDFTDSLSSTDLFVGSDVLIVLDSNVTSDAIAQAAQYMASDAQTITDSLAQSGSYQVSEAQSIADLFASAGALIIFDSAAASDVFTQAAQYMALDAQSITDSVAFLYIFPAIEALSASDALLSADAITWLDQVTVSDSFVAARVLAGSDVLPITDQLSIVVVLIFVETLNVADPFVASRDILNWIDALSVSDLFAYVSSFPLEQTSAIVVAIGRSGSITAIGRSGTAPAAKGR